MKKITYVLLFFSLLLTSCSNKMSLKKCLKDNLEYVTELSGVKKEDVKYLKYSNDYELPKNHILKDVEYEGCIVIDRVIHAVEYKEQESEQRIKENLIRTADPLDFFVYKEGYCHLDSPITYILLYGAPYISNNNNQFVMDENDNDVLLKLNGEGITNIPENINYISGYLELQDTSIDVKHLKTNEELKRIGFSAFQGCENLILIDLNKGLKEISSFAFGDSKQLKRVVIPSSVERIGKSAFVSGDIYCEAKSKPDNWDDEFVSGTAVVHWGDEWEYGKYGNPVLIK